MTRMNKKMMLTNMTMTLILEVMALKVLRVKTFAIGKISNEMSSWLSMLAIVTTTLTAIKSKSYSGGHMPENRSNCWSTGHSKDIQRWFSRLAFVKMRWGSYMSIDYYSHVETGDEILDYPHTYNKLLQDLFCSKAGRAHICGCQVFVEVASSQRRN